MKIKIFNTILIIVILPVLLAASVDKKNNSPVKSSEKIIVAKINNMEITYQDYIDFLNLFNKKPSTLDEKLKMLNHLIERTLIIEDAREKGYFGRKTMKENFKKHSFLKKDNSYQTTIVLRQYFIENISKKVKVTTEEIDDYVKKHKGVDRVTARDYIALGKEKKLYKKLVDKLEKGKKITIFKENLK